MCKYLFRKKSQNNFIDVIYCKTYLHINPGNDTDVRKRDNRSNNLLLSTKTNV